MNNKFKNENITIHELNISQENKNIYKQHIQLVCYLCENENVDAVYEGIDFNYDYDDNNLFRYDFIFDIMDKHGNRIMPFLKENPLYLIKARYTDVFNEFPELKNIKTMKVGIYNNTVRPSMAKQIVLTQKFGLITFKYDSGIVTKHLHINGS